MHGQSRPHDFNSLKSRVMNSERLMHGQSRPWPLDCNSIKIASTWSWPSLPICMAKLCSHKNFNLGNYDDIHELLL